MSSASASDLRIRSRGLPLALLMLTASTGAGAIDLSGFNAVQVRLRTDFELTWDVTLSDGSHTTERTDRLSYDTADEAFKRGRFEGNTYTAGWDERITVPPDKIWTLDGSVSITLSATDPPSVTAFRIEDFSDYPGSASFSAVTRTFLIAGPRTTAIPLVQSSNDTLVFRVTGPASCDAMAEFAIVEEYPQPVEGVVRRELIPPSTCASTGIQVFFEIDLWALPPVTPPATATASVTPSVTATGTTTGTSTQAPSPTPTATPGIDFIADAIEVVQAVQDLHNSVRLVADKRTFVRFHAHANRDSTEPTSARLQVRAATRQTALEPIAPSPGGSGEIRVRRQPRRDVLGHAFLFELPDGFRTGSVELTAEVNPRRSPPEANVANNTPPPVVVLFEAVPAVKLVLYDVEWRNGATLVAPRPVDRVNLIGWMERAYPLSTLRVWKRRYLHAAVPDCFKVDAELETQRLWDRLYGLVGGTLAGAHYYGLFSDANAFAFSGCALDIPSFVASGPTGQPRATLPASSWDADDSYGDYFGAHELGHTWGRHHAEFCGAVARGSRCVGGASNGDYCSVPAHCPGGTCQPEPYPADYVAYPHAMGWISDAVGNHPDAFYGLDTCYGRDCALHLITTSWTDVMTYCNWNWISDFTSDGLLDSYQAAAGAHAATPRGMPADRLLVSGVVELDTRVVHLEPLFVVPQAEELEPNVPGDYAVVLRDAALAQLARYPFTPSESHTDPVDGSDRRPVAFFSELVPYVEGTGAVDIEGPGGRLVRVTAGMRPPTVEVTAPNGGESLSGDALTVSWTASDPDGDPLTFNVQYSADDGASWEMVAQKISALQVAIDRINVTASTEARVRVWASDGIHTASDESDEPFTLADAAPTIAITSPASDLTVAAGQTVRFSAAADDPDLGGLVGEHVEWRSTRDGTLGSGLALSTAGLSVGVHGITAGLDDGLGDVASDTVQVTVVGDVSQLPPLPDALEVAPSPLLLDSSVGALRQTLFIDNQNSGHGIAWQAVASEAWLQLAATSGTTPAETAVAFAGTTLLPGRYRATIAVTSPDLPGVEAAVPVDVVLAAPPSCLGDCDGNGAVTINELITGVNLALAAQQLAQCPAFNRNYDGLVTIDELVAAVSNALGRCPSPERTP